LSEKYVYSIVVYPSILVHYSHEWFILSMTGFTRGIPLLSMKALFLDILYYWLDVTRMRICLCFW